MNINKQITKEQSRVLEFLKHLASTDDYIQDSVKKLRIDNIKIIIKTGEYDHETGDYLNRLINEYYTELKKLY